jgi:hypothetical protein
MIKGAADVVGVGQGVVDRETCADCCPLNCRGALEVLTWAFVS